MRGKTGAIRQEALKTADFNAAENHGKRLDRMGPSRVVRDVPPLVYGSLNLGEARERHMEGVKQQGQTKAIHMLVQFPTDLPGADNEKTQARMLHEAVKFANEYHGGDAVFAARLDRDEKGRHTVDVFLMPRYDFRYKDGRTQKRASVSKFSKQHARALFSVQGDPDGKLDPEGPTMQGRALQAAWHKHLQKAGLKWVEPPNRKATRSKDRLEPEEYALKRRQEDAEAEAVMIRANAKTDVRELVAKAKGQVLDAIREVNDRKAAVAVQERAVEAKRAALEARERDIEARERAVGRDADVVAAFRSQIGRPPEPALKAISEKTRQRQRERDREL